MRGIKNSLVVVLLSYISHLSCIWGLLILVLYIYKYTCDAYGEG